MLCQVLKLVSALTSDVLFGKDGLGFLLSDDKARQYVYNALEEWAADNDDSNDDSLFDAVRTLILSLIREPSAGSPVNVQTNESSNHCLRSS